MFGPRASRRTLPLLSSIAVALATGALFVLPGSAVAATGFHVDNFSQCADGAADAAGSACASWINGDLNPNNAAYKENQSVPQRVELNFSASGPHSVVLEYLARKGSIHAYDSLATWNDTQSTADRCQALTNCPSGPASRYPIPPDPTAEPPATAGTVLTSAHQLPSQVMTLYGGTLTSVSPPVHSSPASGDDLAAVTVTFTVPTPVPTGGAEVELLFGGHLAAGYGPQGWGGGLGAASVSGGPYHISVTSVDGSASGSLDNNIKSGVVAPAVATTLSTTLVNQTTGVSQPGGSPLAASIGNTVHDTAALAGATATAGGTISYTYYPTADCSGTGTPATPTVNTVVNAAVPNSSPVTFTAAGTYSWQASYSGDPANQPATSPCNETLVVAKNAPTLSTTQVNETTHTSLAGGATSLAAAIGNTVHDTAALAGATGGAGGTITYTYYPSDNCSGSGTSATPAGNAVSSGAVPNSNPVPFTAAGTYSWLASYSGDANNAPATSPCNEILVVARNSTSVTTTLRNETAGTTAPAGTTLNASIGDSVHDSVALTGATASAGGTISYSYFPNGTCTGTGTAATPTTSTVTGGGAPNSTTVAFGSAGTYSWQASYSGDANNLPSTSACDELVSVGRNGTSVSTALKNETTSLTAPGGTVLNAGIGDPVHDTVTLGGVTTTAGGTITYSYFSGGACGGTATPATPTGNTVTGGVAPDSITVVFSNAGTYSWQATYSGDANNTGSTSACNEIVVVAQNAPSLSTTLVNGTTHTTAAGGSGPLPAAIGDSVHDTAALAGATGSAGGTVTYRYYTGDTCGGTGIDVTPAGNGVSNGQVPASNPVTFAAAGTYSWQATYSGDANNAAATSSCNEIVTVGQNAPTLATTLHDDSTGTFAPGGSPLSASIGDAVHDTAALTGATAGAGGTISYAFYPNNTCSGTGTSATGSNSTVAGGAVPGSAPVTFTKAGSYYWQATYSGDANNAAATSPCNETVVVGLNAPTLATTLHDDTTGAAAPGGSTLSASIGDAVHDTATLSGATADAGGSISYTYFPSLDCSGTASSATPTPSSFTGGQVPASSPVRFAGAGSYSWRAAYTGDANNAAATSPCNEVVTVAPNSPAITTAATDATSSTGVIDDTATLLGATPGATGTVTFSLYDAAGCTGSPVFTSTVPLTGGTSATSGVYTLQAGSTATAYFWTAAYSGDPNNLAATDPCGAANETSHVPQLGLSKTAAPASGSVVQPGSRIDYTIGVPNTGTAPATDVSVIDTLPPDVSVLTGTIAPSTGTLDTSTASSTSAGTLSWSGLTVPVGGLTLRYSVTVSPAAPQGATLVNTAALGALRASTTHRVPTGALTLVKAVQTPGGTGTATFGDTLVYTLTVSASGFLATQHNVQITDVVPAGTSYTVGSAACTGTPCTAAYDTATGTVSWALGDLASGASRVVTFAVRINPPPSTTTITAETITNVGSVQSTETPATPSNPVQTPVTAVLGLTITRQAPAAPAAPAAPPVAVLPFTGASVPVGVALLVGVGLIGSGLVMTGSAARRRGQHRAG